MKYVDERKLAKSNRLNPRSVCDTERDRRQNKDPLYEDSSD